MQRSIYIAPSSTVDIVDIADALREAGMSVIAQGQLLIVHKPVRELSCDIANYAELPAFLRRQAE